MSDPNRLMKWLLVIGMVVLSLVILYPPGEKLKGGIDLVGGSSLLFEVDTTGLDPRDQRNLSTRVMNILKERVDPKGQLNLEWRPVGNTRLEIRMPRPPKEALRRRAIYNDALERLMKMNLARFDVESALNAEPGERDAALAQLVRGVTERTELLETLKSAFDGYMVAQESEDTSAIEAAAAEYEQAMSDFLATSLPINRFTDILALGQGEKRDAELGKLRSDYASYDGGTPKPLTQAVKAYDGWAANKADLEDPSDLKRRIKGAGVLEFRILADRDPGSPSNTAAVGLVPSESISKYAEQIAKYGPRVRAGDRYRWFAVEDIVRFMHVDNIEEFESRRDQPGQPIIEEYAGRHYVLIHNDADYGLLQQAGKRKKWKLLSAFSDRNPMTGENVVSFQLDSRGGNKFGELTGNNVQRDLCIILDKTAMSWAVIQERITTRCQISGRFTSQRVQELVRTLEAGSLPARLKETPLREQTIGPSLGETNRTKGIWAAVWGAAAVAVFVLFYYGIAAGGMANIALAMNLLFVLAVMALMQATFTLPGIAGLILTVGMAIDANVLIFERIREERDRGVVFKKALNAGYDKAFSTIMDANLTTLIICVILGFVGSEEVKGFAIVLGIGIVTSMFTALFVTRLVFNTLIAKRLLQDLSMRRIIGRPSIDWLSFRGTFWPVSLVMVCSGVGLFVGMSTMNKEAVYDIEFLGGTSVQVDFKAGVNVTDIQMHEAVTSVKGGERVSVVEWLTQAADDLEAATAATGEGAGQFTLASPTLTGQQLADLMRAALDGKLVHDGIETESHIATFIAEPGSLTLESLRNAVASAAKSARVNAGRLRTARVQSVSDLGKTKDTGVSYEIATVVTDRQLVQAALLATLGDDLKIQRRIGFAVERDDELTREPYFVVEAEDRYLSDVIGGETSFDVRRFRGGVAIVANLDETEKPIAVADVEKRLREVALQPEFEQYRTRETAVFPAGAGTSLGGEKTGYMRFAILGVDETLLYDDGPVQWAEGHAQTTLDQVRAALGSEKSLSKVVQFAPQIAQQTKNRAIFAVILALFAIVTYLWFRFGTKEYGLAAIVALVHDVSITLGLVAFSHFVFKSIAGRWLLIDEFKVDLPMIAALLTVIGYSLNDTIVVFDRIRENRGRMGSLTPNLINNSINQTLARTLLTSFTTFLVVAVLYVFGGRGIHGFAFALLIGVVVGTYSSIGIATPLLYRPKLLHQVIVVITGLALIGVVFAEVGDSTVRLVLTGVVAVGCLVILLRGRRTGLSVATARPAGA